MGRPSSFAAFRATQAANAAAGSGRRVRWVLTEKGRAALAAEPVAIGGRARCAWCGQPVRPGEDSTPLGVSGAEVHNEPCLADFDAATHGDAGDSDRAEAE